MPDSINVLIPNADNITIQHLLSHTSGIQNFTDGNGFDHFLYQDSTHYRTWNKHEYFQFLTRDSLDFSPGSDTSYSNTAYILLGYIIEELSGAPYHQVLNKNILEPLGMNFTYVDGFNPPMIPAIDNYSRPTNIIERNLDRISFKKLVNKEFYNLSNNQPFNAWAYSAGAINSNTEDLLRFALAIKDTKVPVPEEWRELMEEREFFDGNGGSLGINSSVFISKKKDIIVIVLLNTSIEGIESWRIANKIYDQMIIE